jgi:t-SNARE complex subunit (syntaxin)
MAWYLHKCGYEPISPFLDDGAKKHIELGKAIDYTKASTKKSRVLALIGYLILAIVILFVIFEVVL